MPTDHQKEIEMLDRRTSQLIDAINKAAHGNSTALKEALINIHKPGWTTIAEIAYTTAILDSVLTQVNNINTLVKTFVKVTGMVSIK
jgi:hypothetical protein